MTDQVSIEVDASDEAITVEGFVVVGPSPTGDHNHAHGTLLELGDPDHPIAAVIGLQAALDGKEDDGTAASAVGVHSAAADPHIGYQKESERGQANGYPLLDAGGKVPLVQLPTGTQSNQVALGDHAHAGGSSGITVQEENITEGTGITTLDFRGVGMDVVVTGSEAVVTVTDGVAGHAIANEGTFLTQRASLNFTGAGVTAVDIGGATVVDIPGGGGSGSVVDIPQLRYQVPPVGEYLKPAMQTSGDYVDETSSTSALIPMWIGQDITVDRTGVFFSTDNATDIAWVSVVTVSQTGGWRCSSAEGDTVIVDLGSVSPFADFPAWRYFDHTPRVIPALGGRWVGLAVQVRTAAGAAKGATWRTLPVVSVESSSGSAGGFDYMSGGYFRPAFVPAGTYPRPSSQGAVRQRLPNALTRRSA
jgi:hypothetical protein